MLHAGDTRRNDSAGGTEKAQKKKHVREMTVSKKFRTVILAALLIVLIISMSINITASLQYGKGEMQRVVSDYERQLTEWIKTQKSILDMFCSMISTDADRLNRYDDMVAYLDSITKQYPDGDGIA